MIPSNSKALLMATYADDSRSLASTWAGLGLAILFLACAAIYAS